MGTSTNTMTVMKRIKQSKKVSNFVVRPSVTLVVAWLLVGVAYAACPDCGATTKYDAYCGRCANPCSEPSHSIDSAATDLPSNTRRRLKCPDCGANTKYDAYCGSCANPCSEPLTVSIRRLRICPQTPGADS